VGTADNLQVGDRVRLKARIAPDIQRVMRGGEGVVEEIGQDMKGTVIWIRMNSGSVRAARPEHLVIHRKNK
jgi:hypothetical protein